MSATRGNAAQERELVFCYACENEWYRDEHGLICPDCDSEFVEVLEGNNDPRGHVEEEPDHLHDFHAAPDPDEDDIDHFQWQGQQPTNDAAHRQFPSNFNTAFPPGSLNHATIGPGMPGMGTGLLGILGGVLRTAFAPPEGHTHGDEARQRTADDHNEAHAGSPPADEQRLPPGTFVHHRSGPNFSWTITSTTTGNLPRNAGRPQPFNQQPENIDDLLDHMLSSFGGRGPTVVRVGGNPGAPGAGPRGDATAAFNAFADFFGGFPRGQMGDAVFSQEAMDRVISQLMDQHANGTAPGPASRQAIESLPTREISEKDLADTGKAECSICMDETPIGTTVTVLPCTHWFHHDCIKAWLSEHDTCPHCRQGITPKEPQAGSEQVRQSGEAPLHDASSASQPSSSSIPREFPSAPGGYPSSPSTSRRRPGSSSQQATAQTRPPAQRASSGGGGIFSRMRDAFGGGSSGSGS